MTNNSNRETPQNPNTVAFVGAGPGAPDLLTVRACQRIRNAEVLVWADSLVAPAIADLAPDGCERIPTRSLTLEAVTALLLHRVAMGKRVVRLHDGDPSLYGAVHEQICRLADANVAVEMVPGISAYQATAAALAKELTVPGVVQTVVITRAGGRTGPGRAGKPEPCRGAWGQPLPVSLRAPRAGGARRVAEPLPAHNTSSDRLPGELA